AKTNSRNGNTGGNHWSTTSTPITTAVRTALIYSRVRSMPSTFQLAEAAHALGVVAQRLLQRAGVKLRPAFFRDPQLGVGDLPEQEVADAHLAGGADEQVGVG